MTRPFFKQILKDLESRPDDFKISKHTLKDTKTGVQFWICNGLWFYSVYEPKMKFSIVEKVRFAWATRKILENYESIMKDLEEREKFVAKKALEKMFETNKGE